MTAKPKTIAASICLLLAGGAVAQNLVPNPSFEDYFECPNSFTGPYLHFTLNDWFVPNQGGTTDYFNACSQDFGSNDFPPFGVPQNLLGYQQAHDGQAYLGLFNMLRDGEPPQQELASIQLTEPLEANRYYHVEYYVSLADSVWWDRPTPNLQFFDSFGAAVSQESPTNIFPPMVYNIPYAWPVQVQSPAGIFFDDSLGWQKFEGTFVAQGGERFLTIGSFEQWDQVQSNYIHSEPYESMIETYYYIDDVSLEALDSFYVSVPDPNAVSVPNVFTPDGDGVNDLFTLIQPAGQQASVVILNRWGREVYRSEPPFAWDGTANGELCSEGVYFYRVETPNGTLHGIVQLVR